MKSLFPEYFPLEERDYDDLWKNGLVVLDTNVLLRLYRYNETTVSEVLNVLEKLGDRLWLPYQVAWEYNRRRLDKIREAEKSYSSLISEFKRAAESGSNKLRDMKDFGIHPTLKLEKSIRDLVDDIEKKTNIISKEYDDAPTGDHYSSIHDRVGILYKEKIGKEPNKEELKSFCAEGDARYQERIPPGFRDVDEKRKRGASDQEAFGDFLIWREIINRAKEEKKSVIFVTEDAKDDWWLREDGKTIGPLPQLRKEFISEAGSQVHFYRIDNFLEQARTRLSAQLSHESVIDIKKNSEPDTIGRWKISDVEVNILPEQYADIARRLRDLRVKLPSSDLVEKTSDYSADKIVTAREKLSITERDLLEASAYFQSARSKFRVLTREAESSGGDVEESEQIRRARRNLHLARHRFDEAQNAHARARRLERRLVESLRTGPSSDDDLA